MNELQTSRLMERARAFADEGKHLHAEQIYHRLIRDEPVYIAAYTELAALYAEQGQIEASIRIPKDAKTRILRNAQHQFPGNTEITFMLGTLYLRNEAFDNALAQFKMLADRKLPHVHFNMGVAYFYKQNLKRAEEQFRLTLKYDPHFPKIHETLAELLIRRNSYAQAIAHLKRAVAIEPYSWIGHYLLGVCYQAILDFKNAYEEFVLAVEMDPSEANSWLRCGEVLLELKRHEEAERYLRKALELDPNSADALANLGHLYLARGDAPRSSEFFTKALSVDPHNPRARLGRVQTRISQKK